MKGIDSSRIMGGAMNILGFLNKESMTTEGPYSIAEKLLILKMSTGYMENLLAVEGLLTMYKISFDKLESK